MLVDLRRVMLPRAKRIPHDYSIDVGRRFQGTRDIQTKRLLRTENHFHDQTAQSRGIRQLPLEHQGGLVLGGLAQAPTDGLVFVSNTRTQFYEPTPAGF